MAVRDPLRTAPPAHRPHPGALVDPAVQLLLLTLAGLSAGAAGIHFAVAPAHLAEQPLEGWFFVAVAISQAAWAILIPRYPHRRLLAAGALGNLVIAALWLFVRLRGLPLGEQPWTPEAFGLPDTTSAAFEVAIALGVLLLGTRRRLPVRHLAGPAVVVALMLVAVTGVALLSVGIPQ
jgi:hypothetical protein